MSVLHTHDKRERGTEENKATWPKSTYRFDPENKRDTCIGEKILFRETMKLSFAIIGVSTVSAGVKRAEVNFKHFIGF